MIDPGTGTTLASAKNAKDAAKVIEQMPGVENRRMPVMTAGTAVDGTVVTGMDVTSVEVRTVSAATGTRIGTKGVTRTGTTANNATTNVVIDARTGTNGKAKNSVGTTANRRKCSTSMPSWKRMASLR
jgi:hypothetical protein